MVSADWEIRSGERALFKERGKPLPFNLMNEKEQDLFLEKSLKGERHGGAIDEDKKKIKEDIKKEIVYNDDVADDYEGNPKDYDEDDYIQDKIDNEDY